MKDLDEMDDEGRRFRSPSFRQTEIEALIKLVAKFKNAVLNKSTSAAASQVKDAAWVNIAAIFNKQGFEPLRTSNMLRIKWENLKRNTKNYSNNKTGKNEESNYIREQVFNLVNQCNEMRDSFPSNIPEEVQESIDDKELFTAGKSESNTESNEIHSDLELRLEQVSEKSEDEDYNDFREKAMRVRSANFSPEECSLLLKCVRSEKDAIFNRKTDAINNFKKIQAWKRVTKNYNNLSSNNRTGTVLLRKFWNLRKTARNIGSVRPLKKKFKQHSACELPFKRIKKEPLLEIDDEDISILSEDGQNTIMELDNNNVTIDSNQSYQPDPLTLECSQADKESDCPTRTCILTENKDETKLRLQLLNYKLETAKIERKRLEDLINVETIDRKLKEKEMALRLRAARLEAIAAEMKIPANHPALIYTPDEIPAQSSLQ